MKHKKLKKRLIIIGVSVVAVIGIIFGVIALNQNSRRAYVQPVSDLNMTYEMGSQTFSGTVAESAQQKITVSSDNKVDEVFVSKGDKVKKGDKLFQYDTRLLELSLEEKQLTVSINETALSNEKKKLEEYQNIVPVTIQPTEEPQETEAVDETLAADATEAEAVEGPAEEPLEEPASEKTYTEQEKADLIADQKIAVSRAQTALESSKEELAEAQQALDEAVVTSKMDGTVGDIQSPDSVDNTVPFCVIIGDTGVTLKGYVGEFDYAELHVGDSLLVSSFMTDTQTSAEVLSISDYPSDSQSFGSGNPNTSYYEFTAFIPQSAGFDIGEDVQITKDESEEGDMSGRIMLSKAYVRTDSKGSYVLKDVDGRLQRQDVKTKKTSGSESLEITEGLSLDDMIAFPYGSKGKEGLLTTTEEQGPSLF